MKNYLLLFTLLLSVTTIAQDNQLFSVSADKMNVLYIGVMNPVTIIVQDVKPEDLVVKVGSGKVIGENGEYKVSVREVGVTEIQVAYLSAKGDTISVGSKQFRVKRVPDPTAKIGNVTGEGSMKASTLVALGEVHVDFDIDFDIRFRVKGFQLVTVPEGADANVGTFESTSNKLSADMKKRIESLSKGDIVYIQAIRAIGPDGATRKLAPLAITIS